MWYLSYPWVVDETGLTAEQLQFIERSKAETAELGFNGNAFKNSLDEIRANDKHLAECCASPLMLANFLDAFVVMPLVLASEQGATQEQLHFAYSEFETLTYCQGKFKRIALSHLFNCDMQGDLFELGDSRIVRVDASRIPQFLGESGFQAFLHPTTIGTCFVVDEDGASEISDIDWLSAQRAKASTIAMVLQYFKDGVVHLGYTVPVFSPD